MNDDRRALDPGERDPDDIGVAATRDREGQPIASQPSGLPEIVGDYKIVREVGRGGMGIVYEALHPTLSRRVALKVMSSGHLLDPRAVTRFHREAQAFARLHHQNIVEVYDLGIEGGVPYFAMEFVEGETVQQIQTGSPKSASGTASGPFTELSPNTLFTLSRLLETEEWEVRVASLLQGETESGLAAPGEAGRVTVAACKRIADAFAGAAEGLHHAHGRGVIHRDMKPSNLILDRSTGRLRILDFGLARVEGEERLTGTGHCVGTPLYMSPEQTRLRDGPIGPGTDIYSLGVTLYEVLTGRPPLYELLGEGLSRGGDSRGIMNLIASRDPKPPRALNPVVPRDLETIVLKCLRKEPRERYATAEALAQDLRRFARGDPIEARSPTLVERVVHRARRNKDKVIMSAVILVLLAGIGWLGLRTHFESRLRAETQYELLIRRGVMKTYRGLTGSGMRAGSRTEARYIDGFFMPREMLLPVRRDFQELVRNKAKSAAAEAALVSRAGLNPLEEAVKELREAAAMFPGRPDAYYHLAKALFLLERDGEALRVLDGTREFVPARILRAAVLEEMGDAEGARDEIERAESLSNGGPPEAWLRAHRAMATADWLQAAGAYGELIDLTLERGEPYLGSSIESLLGRGVALLEAGDFLGAIEDFSRAHGRWPGSVEPLLLTGKAYLLQGKDGLAERKFEELFSRSAAKDPIALGIAIIYASLGDNRRGLDWAQSLSEGHIRDRTRAAFLIKLGRWQEAAAAAAAAVADRPDDALAHLWLGLALLSDEQDYARAIDVLRTANALDRKNPMAHIWLGDALARQGQLDEALDEYRIASQLDPKNAWLHLSRGVTFERNGEIREALAEFRKAFEIDPSLSSIYIHLENLLSWEKGRPPDLGPELCRFIRVLERFLERGEDHPLLTDLLKILSLMLIRDLELRDADKALRYATLAVEKTQRQDPELLAVLARVQFAARRRAEAVLTLEEALQLPHASRLLPDQLEEYRRAIRPDLVSCASIDAALEANDTEILVPVGAEWRYFRGRRDPSPGMPLRWTEPDFDDREWENGRSGFGYGDGDDETMLSDMKGSYSTVYIRKKLRIEDPARYSRLVLTVRVDDGCVAYLNGQQVCRLNLESGEAPLPHDAVAAITVATEPLLPYEFEVDSRLLRPGDNVLAIQGFNSKLTSSDVSLIPELEARIASEPEKDRELLEAFRSIASGPDARMRILYLEGRTLARSGEHLEAVERFDELVGLESSRPEPALRLAESLKAAGRPEEAASRLLGILRERQTADGEDLWDLWVRLCLVDLERPPGEVLAVLPEATEGRGRDVRRALERLHAGGGIRINCGGVDHRDHRGRLWFRDCFVRSGCIFGGRSWDLLTGDRVLANLTNIAGTVDDPLYQTERWFPTDELRLASYCIPVVPGRYRVTLHFAEVYFRDPRQRFFDVSIEGERVLSDYEPLSAGFATAATESFDITAADGFVDIELVPRQEHPKISAIEIEPVNGP